MTKKEYAKLTEMIRKRAESWDKTNPSHGQALRAIREMTVIIAGVFADANPNMVDFEQFMRDSGIWE